MKKALLLLLLLIIMPLLVVNSIFLISGTTTPFIAVSTESMAPSYRGYFDNSSGPYNNFPPGAIPVHWARGDLLLLRGSSSSFSTGDVIVFDTTATDITVIHRVVAKEYRDGNWFYLTKGDGNPASDASSVTGGNNFGWIAHSSVHGEVVACVPAAGWPVLALVENIFPLTVLVALIILLTGGKTDSESPDPPSRFAALKSRRDRWRRKTTWNRNKGNHVILFLRSINSRRLILSAAAFTAVIFLLLSLITFSSGNCSAFLLTSQPGITEYWDVEGGTIVAYNTPLIITSRGLFNHVYRIDIITGGENGGNNSDHCLYRWITVKITAGTVTVTACLKFFLPHGSSFTSGDVVLSLFTTGLFNQGVLRFNYTLLLPLITSYNPPLKFSYPVSSSEISELSSE